MTFAKKAVEISFEGKESLFTPQGELLTATGIPLEAFVSHTSLFLRLADPDGVPAEERWTFWQSLLDTLIWDSIRPGREWDIEIPLQGNREP